MSVRSTFRRLSEPDGYERTELVEMLCLVRKHQRQQGWTQDHIEDVDMYADAKADGKGLGLEEI